MLNLMLRYMVQIRSPIQAEFGKDKLRDNKDALKKLYDTSKQKLRAMTSKVETSTKVVEKDKAERSEMEIEARKIKLYNSFGKQVLFSVFFPIDSKVSARTGNITSL